MGNSAFPNVIHVPTMVIIFIDVDNISINYVVINHQKDHNGNADPVCEDVEAGKDLLYTAIYIAHFDFKA